MNSAVTSLKLAGRSMLASALCGIGAAHYFGPRMCPYRILMYHRIVDPERLPYPLQEGMYVRPSTFRRHLEYLGRYCHVIQLDELAQRLAAGQPVAERTVAITFDDGWYDNYTNAWPLLKQLGLPATVFVATSYIGTDRIFWTDAAGLIVKHLHSQHLLSTSEPQIQSDERIDRKTLLKIKDLYRQLGSLPLPTALNRFVEFLGELEPHHRNDLVQNIHSSLETANASVPRSFLSWEEVSELSAAGMTIGNHSHSHFLLSDLSTASVAEDIAASYQAFEQHHLPCSQVFCYPAGAYSELTQQVLAERGVSFALTTSKTSNLTAVPALLGRIGIHQDIAATPAMLASRMWLEKIF
jgi:peptidoglycan/xylan/chitin deacetylase (PgdA/CDA1 family)